MKRRTASILLVGLSFSTLALGQTQSPSIKRLISVNNEENRRGSRAKEDVERLSRTADRVERAFEDGDADELESCLSEKRIYVSLKARGEEAGYFGRSQVKHMLGKLFRERKTDSFTYDRADLDVSGGQSAAFRAEWTYLAREADAVVTEELRFKLDRAEGPDGPDDYDWRVSEIRAQIQSR
jgi:hypothetical protein